MRVGVSHCLRKRFVFKVISTVIWILIKKKKHSAVWKVHLHTFATVMWFNSGNIDPS